MANWTNELNPFGQNRTPVIVGWASDNSGVAVPVAVDKTTGRLLVNATGSSGGTSSTFGQAFPSTGTAVGASDGTNMQPLLVDGSGYLEVNVKTGGGGGTQYTEGATQSTPVGTVALWRDNSNVLHSANPSNGLPVNPVGALQTGSNIIGKVGIDQTTPGTTNAVSIEDASGNGLTSNSTTYTSKHALDANLLGTLGTAFTTAGLVDIKGTDGNVFVRQSTAANLKATANLNDGSGNSITSTGNALDVNIKTGNITGFATSANQTNASQKTQIVDGSGNVIASTSNALNVDVTNSTLAVTQSGTWLTSENASASATGFSMNYQSGLTNTKVAVKATGGLFTGWHIYNGNNAITYIQVFNVASASVTLGSTAPTFVIVVPANGWEDFPPTMPGIAFGTAITLAATTTASGATAPTNNLIATFWYI